ncbi:MAG: hypothetical protein VB140_10215 [Burkholderia sp.]
MCTPQRVAGTGRHWLPFSASDGRCCKIERADAIASTGIISGDAIASARSIYATTPA